MFLKHLEPLCDGLWTGLRTDASTRNLRCTGCGVEHERTPDTIRRAARENEVDFRLDVLVKLGPSAL